MCISLLLKVHCCHGSHEIKGDFYNFEYFHFIDYSKHSNVNFQTQNT